MGSTGKCEGESYDADDKEHGEKDRSNAGFHCTSVGSTANFSAA